MSKWNRHEKEERQNTVGVPKLHMLVINRKRARFDANRFNQVNKEEWTCTLTENTWKVIKWKQKYTKARQLLADEWRRRTYAQLYKYLLKGVLSFLFLYFSLEEMGEKVGGGGNKWLTLLKVCVCIFIKEMRLFCAILGDLEFMLGGQDWIWQRNRQPIA